jgi:hypothetical protein
MQSAIPPLDDGCLRSLKISVGCSAPLSVEFGKLSLAAIHDGRIGLRWFAVPETVSSDTLSSVGVGNNFDAAPENDCCAMIPARIALGVSNAPDKMKIVSQLDPGDVHRGSPETEMPGTHCKHRGNR